MAAAKKKSSNKRNLVAIDRYALRKRREETVDQSGRMLTQERLAAQVGISAQQLSDYETGKTKRCEFSTLKRIADALNVPLSDLLMGQHRRRRGKGAIYFLKGTDAVYSSSVELCGTVERQIRIFHISAGPGPSIEYTERITQILSQKKDAGTPVTIEVYVGVDLKNPPPDLISTMAERFAVAERLGVTDLVSAYVIDTRQQIGFDVFIIDRKHAYIGFVALPGFRDIERTIVFENQPDIVTEIVDWFTNIVTGVEKVRYEDWMRERG